VFDSSDFPSHYSKNQVNYTTLLIDYYLSSRKPHTLIKNFIKNRERRAIFGKLLFIQNAIAHSTKVFASLFQKASGGGEVPPSEAGDAKHRATRPSKHSLCEGQSPQGFNAF